MLTVQALLWMLADQWGFSSQKFSLNLMRTCLDLTHYHVKTSLLPSPFVRFVLMSWDELMMEIHCEALPLMGTLLIESRIAS